MHMTVDYLNYYLTLFLRTSKKGDLISIFQAADLIGEIKGDSQRSPKEWTKIWACIFILSPKLMLFLYTEEYSVRFFN